MSMIVYLRGGGDLASGVALRLHRAGIRLIISELPQPLVVRRMLSFAEAVYQGEFNVEGVIARLVPDISTALECIMSSILPVVIDPEAELLEELYAAADQHTPIVLIDGRMTKQPVEFSSPAVDFNIGLGPGFTAGKNCHAAIETNRGHRLGRVILQGSPQADTGIPEMVSEQSSQRVLRSPADGIFHIYSAIGDQFETGQIIAEVGEIAIHAPFKGCLRGLLHPGVPVKIGMKVGDLDPKGDPSLCTLVSDKSLAVGGGVLEAILSQRSLRPFLWD